MRLECRGIRKRFGTFEALRGIDYATPDGVQCLTVIGPSGGGKSTWLRVCAGLEIPEEGELEVQGRPVPDDPKGLLDYRRSIGTVFQAFNLFPHLTALDNLVVPLVEVHGLAKPEAENRAMETLSRFGLGEHARKKPAQLSGGQRQRVAIARAVAFKPRLLFFDEPTSALDPVMTGEVLSLIEELKQEGVSLFVVTHEIGFARHVADEVVFIEEGRIAAQGSPEAVLENPEVESCRHFLASVLRY